jgi:hypothetical protein
MAIAPKAARTASRASADPNNVGVRLPSRTRVASARTIAALVAVAAFEVPSYFTCGSPRELSDSRMQVIRPRRCRILWRAPGPGRRLGTAPACVSSSMDLAQIPTSRSTRDRDVRPRLPSSPQSLVLVPQEARRAEEPERPRRPRVHHLRVWRRGPPLALQGEARRLSKTPYPEMIRTVDVVIPGTTAVGSAQETDDWPYRVRLTNGSPSRVRESRRRTHEGQPVRADSPGNITRAHRMTASSR